MERGSILANAKQVWPLLGKYLYDRRDVFIRELLANAADALEKVRFLSRTVDSLGSCIGELRIDVRIDRQVKTVTISDNGIGMTYEEVQKYINQMAVSGAADFVKQFGASQGIIGFFGVGFYSSFLVSDAVTIKTQSYQEQESACRWRGTPDAEWEMERISRIARGTAVTLDIAKDFAEYLNEERIGSLVRKYCDYLGFPVFVNDGLANKVEAPWHLNKGSLPPRAYQEFYRRLYPEANNPRLWLHIEADFPISLRGILYVPSERQAHAGIRLFCKRVFIEENFREAAPPFLAFLQGVIEIDGIPLNLPRERLQDDAMLGRVRSFIARKCADEFSRLAQERREDFAALWTAYERPTKVAAVQDDQWLKSLYPHFLFSSSRGAWTSITEYLERNRARQKSQIYYATDLAKQRAYLDDFRSRGREVIFFTNQLDLLLLERARRELPDLADFERIDFAQLGAIPQTAIGDGGAASPAVAGTETVPPREEAAERAFCSLFTTYSGGLEVTMTYAGNASHPVLLIRKGADSRRADVEDLIRGMKPEDLPETVKLSDRSGKWTLVLNGNHPLIQSLRAIHRKDYADPLLGRSCELLYQETAVKFGLANEDATASFFSKTEAFITWICEQSPRVN